MEQPDKNPVSSDKLVPSTRRKSIALSIFLIFTGFVSLLAALIGWGSRIFRVGNLFEKWDEISTILFYFSTGIIILLIERVYKKSQIPNEMKGGAIGLTLYVAINWAADFVGELNF